MVVGAHIDQTTQQKIVDGEYIDFSKLIPRDKIVTEEDVRMELMLKDGKAFWTPVGHREGTYIGHFQRWEQAFHIYSNICTRAHPHRSSELIQYNHIINTFAMTYTWENVYAYDKDFRMHMAKFPDRNWAIILHQAWAMRLKDCLRSEGSSGQNQNAGANRPKHQFNSATKGSEPCRRLNRGKCNFGTNCRYEHRCTYCGKYGHGFFNCRKTNSDRDKQGGNTPNKATDHGGNPGLLKVRNSASREEKTGKI